MIYSIIKDYKIFKKVNWKKENCEINLKEIQYMHL